MSYKWNANHIEKIFLTHYMSHLTLIKASAIAGAQTPIKLKECQLSQTESKWAQEEENIKRVQVVV